MIITSVDACIPVIQIRQLAALCQDGEDYHVIKDLIDCVIREFNTTLGRDRDVRLAAWTELLNQIERYCSNMSDPVWLNVMNHARMRVKSRRQTVLNYRKIKRSQ